MTNKLKRHEDQPAIKDFLSTPNKKGQNQVHKVDNKYVTPADSKHKQSPPSDNKPVKKLNLDADSSDTEDTVKENVADPKKMSGESKDSSNESLTDQPTPEQIAFENRLIAKFSELMSEKLKPLENSIKELTECQ